MVWSSFLPIRNIQKWRWLGGWWLFQIDRLIHFLIRIIIITTITTTTTLMRSRKRRRGI